MAFRFGSTLTDQSPSDLNVQVSHLKDRIGVLEQQMKDIHVRQSEESENNGTFSLFSHRLSSIEDNLSELKKHQIKIDEKTQQYNKIVNPVKEQRKFTPYVNPSLLIDKTTQPFQPGDAPPVKKEPKPVLKKEKVPKKQETKQTKSSQSSQIDELLDFLLDD